MQASFNKNNEKVCKCLKYKGIKSKNFLEKDLHIKILNVNRYIFFGESGIKI